MEVVGFTKERGESGETTLLFAVLLVMKVALDPSAVLFVGALAVYLVIALLATAGPARRAAACEPWQILKD